MGRAFKQPVWIDQQESASTQQERNSLHARMQQLPGPQAVEANLLATERLQTV